jgi:c-di-GMP-binding flagellar brake protein YcgR
MTDDYIRLLTPEVLVSGQIVRLMAMETIKSKWTTSVVGCRKNRYIILEIPRINGLPVIFEDNSNWSINFIRQGHIYNFKSRAISSISRPFPLIFFSYPDVVEVANLRNEKRYPVNIPFVAQTDSETPFQVKGLFLDLSWGGGLAATTVEIPDEPLRISLYINGSSSIDGLIMEKKGSRNKQGTFYTGLSFLPNQSPVIDQLGVFIQDIENIPLRL